MLVTAFELRVTFWGFYAFLFFTGIFGWLMMSAFRGFGNKVDYSELGECNEKVDAILMFINNLK